MSPISNFNGNPSSGSRAGTCRQTDKTEQTGKFLDYANAPKSVRDIKHRPNYCIQNLFDIFNAVNIQKFLIRCVITNCGKGYLKLYANASGTAHYIPIVYL
jgi:hypothetical protein